MKNLLTFSKCGFLWVSTGVWQFCGRGIDIDKRDISVGKFSANSMVRTAVEFVREAIFAAVVVRDTFVRDLLKEAKFELDGVSRLISDMKHHHGSQQQITSVVQFPDFVNDYGWIASVFNTSP
jgi:hypothetical protein